MMGAHSALIQVADYVAQNSPPNMSFRDLMHYDMFAGARNMQRAYCALFALSDYMDMTLRIDDDICTTVGFISAVRCILKLKPLALATIGLPCGSFVWINSATSKRSAARPYGNEDLPHVAKGNKIAARVCLLLLLLTARRVLFMLEQPFSSKLELLPFVRDVFDMISEVIPVHRVFFWMGNYGHFSCKGSLAYSNLPFIGRLGKKLSNARRERLRLSSHGVVHRRVRHGRVAVTGDRLLKKTQEYPRKFCKKILRLHLKSVERHGKKLQKKMDSGPRLLLGRSQAGE
ncbi:RHM1 [Symbiodinium sp. CCMP2592]|nr:RHM1 [Symbiodinium sp. CCMP2592]CAE7597943.1 RHM1 [Symbiodinium sp. CCMP2592]